MLLSGAWEKGIHEKNLKQKISWHCPFEGSVSEDVFIDLLRLLYTVQPEQTSERLRDVWSVHRFFHLGVRDPGP
jgi:hypothetical protein